LYLASGAHNPADFNDTMIYGFSTTGTLTRSRTLTIHDMHYVTAITENPATGMLYVVGFYYVEIILDESPDEMALPFYEARLAKVAYGATEATAQALGGAHDLALPVSILWTGTTSCGGANLAGGSTVDFLDFAVIGSHWLDSPCAQNRL